MSLIADQRKTEVWVFFSVNSVLCGFYFQACQKSLGRDFSNSLNKPAFPKNGGLGLKHGLMRPFRGSRRSDSLFTTRS